MPTPATIQVEIDSAIRKLESIWETSLKDGVTTSFLEIRDNHPRETTLRADWDGLVAFAIDVLRVAASGTEGHHAHIDEAGIADHCDRKLVIAYASAPSAKELSDAR
jgi:hypothetical protein